MSIYKTAIEKPVTTALIFVAVIVIGLFAFSRLPIDQFPEMDPPYVTVMTTYPGANASEVETNVTKLVENALNSVDGLKHLTSNSKDNISVVTLELEWGSNLDEATNDIRSYLDMMKDNLPDGCSTPMVFKLNTSMMPVIQYYVTAKESYPGLDKILNDEVVTQLNRVDGIGTISLSGAPDRYVYVVNDQSKLDTYGITLEAVGSAISGSNLNLSSGTVKMEKEQYQLQVRSEFEESAEIENLVVANTPFGKIFVRDIATVRDTIKDLTLDEKVNGQEAVRMMVSKKSGANTVQVCKDVRSEMEKIKSQLPSDINIGIIYDSSENIQGAINSLEESILYALLFVVLVVLLFLGKWRATFIIGITIPISLIVAFIYLLFTGSSLNIISLSSLTVAIGMVVDDAIVVLENITTHIERGSSPREASIYATNEVWISVIATTLVIVAVFVPLTMLNGMAGIMFKELGWIVTIVVCTSTTVAISLTPMLCSQLLKARKVSVDENGHLVQHDVHKGWYQKYIVSALDRIDAAYARLLGWCLNHKGTTLAIAAAFFIFTLIPVFAGRIGTDFMHSGDNGRLSVKVELQRGTRIEETLKTARALEADFKQAAPEIQIISTSAGSNDDAGLSSLFSSTSNNKISMTIRLPKKYERERTVWEIAESLRGVMNQRPEIVTYTASTSSGMGMGGANTADLEIYGYDFDETNILAEELKRKFEALPGARDVEIDREKDRSEIEVVFDKEKLARHGLSTSVAAMYLRNRVSGYSAGYLKEDGEEYDIRVRLQEKYRDSMSDVEEMAIMDAYGKTVKIKELAEIHEYWAPPEIKRKSRQRIVTVKVTPEGTSLGEMAAAMQAVVDKTDIPLGIHTDFGGAYEDQQETFADMAVLLVMIIMLVYIVMASQFEDFRNPLIIMISALFALPGVIFMLLVTDTNLDMIGALGLILLVGIVVKNGIVLVDYINLNRERGLSIVTSIVSGGKSRLRPVLMTTATTVLGMLPMALGIGEGSELWQPMGIVIVGGLLVSTLVTLVLIPTLYGSFSASQVNRKRKRFFKIS